MAKSRKYSRRKRSKNLDFKKQKELLGLIEKKKYNPKITTNRKSQQFNLTEDDRITYIYEITYDRKIVEVVDVSYELKVNEEWLTIVRYDSEHGYLHRHSRIKNFEKEIVTTIGVKKKGNAGKWLTWAIKDITSRYENYKRGFLKKNRQSLSTNKLSFSTNKGKLTSKTK